jgi:hypothetical protein
MAIVEDLMMNMMVFVDIYGWTLDNLLEVCI